MSRVLTEIEKIMVEKEIARVASRDIDWKSQDIDWKLVVNELVSGRVLRVEGESIIAYRKIFIIDSPMNWIPCKFSIENLRMEEMIIIDDLWHHFRSAPIPKKIEKIKRF